MQIHGFLTEHLYTKNEDCKRILQYTGYTIPKEMKEGQEVFALHKRVSWERQDQFLNKHHGFIFLPGVIKIDDLGRRHVNIDYELIEKFMRPMGKETTDQLVTDCNYEKYLLVV